MSTGIEHERPLKTLAWIIVCAVLIALVVGISWLDHRTLR